MKFGKLLAVAAIAGLLLPAAANATLFWNETFTYDDGGLTAASGDDVSGGNWVNHSGTAGFIQVNSGEAILVSGAAEDANRAIPEMGASDIYYAGFDVTVDGSNAATNQYFAHFLQGTSSFNSRVYVVGPKNGGTDFTFGFEGTAVAPTLFWSSDLSYGTTYRLVVSYDYDSGAGQLWVDPVNMASPSLSDPTGFAGNEVVGFALRQSSGNTSESIDNILVGTTFADALPEPASLTLLALGGLAVLRRR